MVTDLLAHANYTFEVEAVNGVTDLSRTQRLFAAVRIATGQAGKDSHSKLLNDDSVWAVQCYNMVKWNIGIRIDADTNAKLTHLKTLWCTEGIHLFGHECSRYHLGYEQPDFSEGLHTNKILFHLFWNHVLKINLHFLGYDV